MSELQDTITAVATPPGKGGVGIIRISGSRAKHITEAISKKVPTPRLATCSKFYDRNNQIIDLGIILFFPGPNSFTGEDVIEFQVHGGPIILDVLLSEIISHGARVANPGEFSFRAFLNDKMDLAQAEAVADLIDAGSRQAAAAALNSLQGIFSDKIHEVQQLLIHLRMYVEAAIDFPEEEIDFLNDKKINLKIEEVKDKIREILGQAQQGKILKEGVKMVIIGKPNAGKSSLLNLLSGEETAIVTEVAGTTRDVVREYIQIDGIPVHIMDTAGLRETMDIVEQIGIARTFQEIEKADIVICLIDVNEYKKNEIRSLIHQWKIADKTLIFVKNKIDLTGEKPVITYIEKYPVLGISAKTGLGLDNLKQVIKEKIGFVEMGAGNFIARRRHIDALERALDCVEQGEAQLIKSRAGELLAEDLRMAQVRLSEITGEFTSDDLLGEIFSRFCIGK